jgi:hypothetical protein
MWQDGVIICCSSYQFLPILYAVSLINQSLNQSVVHSNLGRGLNHPCGLLAVVSLGIAVLVLHALPQSATTPSRNALRLTQ